MSTVRIQVRRGTASQWTSVNPILAAGEMGVESDSNLFKFGNGSSTWTALSYANNSDVAIGEISQDAINSALTMGSGLTKTYNDGANTITIAVDASYFNELAQDAIDSALTAGTGISKVYSDSGNTISLAVDTSVIANRAYVDNAVSGLENTVTAGYLEVSDRGANGGVASLNNSGKVPASELDITNTVVSLIDSTVISGRGVSSTWDNATSKEVVAAAIRAQGGIVKTNATDNLDIILSLSPTITATTKFNGPLVQVDAVEADTATIGSLTVSGNLNVNGTTTSVNSTNVTIDDPMIYIGENNQSNVLDLGVVAAFNNGTYQHSGLVRDASDGVWKLFSGVTAEPTTVVDFTTYTKDSLEVGGLVADSLRVGSVVNAEVQRLAGVTSGIQSQIDAKIESSTADSRYATKVSPTFTGTVTLPAGTVTAGMILDGTIMNADINNYAEIAQSKVANLTSDLSTLTANVALNAPKASPTFTGTVTLPLTTSIGDVSATEIGYVNGVTSGIQYQIDTVSSALAAKVTSYDSSLATLFTDTSTLTTDLNTAENAITGLQSDVTAINTAAATLQTSVNTKATTAALASHEADTTNIHGIVDTSVLATATTVATAKSEAIAAASTDATTKANAAKTAAEATAAAALTTAISTEVTGRNSAIATAKSEAIADATSQVTAVINNAPAAFDTLKEIADYISADQSAGSALTTSVALKAPLASPTFTGTVTVGAAGIVFSDGTQTRAAVPSITTIATERSASQTLAAGEQDKFVPLSGAVVITLPATGYSTGQSIDFWQSTGTGASFASTNGVIGTPGLKFRTTNSVVTALKISSGWLVFGDLSA
jgi:hypothetical protein